MATQLTELKGGLVVNSDGVKGAKTVWGNQAPYRRLQSDVKPARLRSSEKRRFLSCPVSSKWTFDQRRNASPVPHR